ncbi:MAG: DEAD/DEAH box helicase [Alistipes sp.]
MTFQDLQLIQPIMRAVEEKGYTQPTPIQEQAIPPVLAGRDLLGCAQTGTGKTAAFTLPIIQLLASTPRKRGVRVIQALILTPTRELAIQIDECCRDYACHTDINHCVIFGGVNQNPQVRQLQRGVDLLIATPGRLLDLMNQGYISLNAVRFFVLDEADRMLDMGFIHDIKRLLPKLPKEKQTLFFSATIPDSIRALTDSLLRDPVHVSVTPEAPVVDTISQTLYFVEKSKKSDLLINLLRRSSEGSVLVFSRTKHGADKIAKTLDKAGIASQAIHGNKSQNARQRAMTDFKSGVCRVMIATDIAARGIDVSELPLVINYDLPEVPETYVHRIGRTGRAGCTGAAFSFCSEDERLLLRDIEKTIGMGIPRGNSEPNSFGAIAAAPAAATARTDNRRGSSGRASSTSARTARPSRRRPSPLSVPKR